jgi:hypothetical protein
MYAEPQSDPLGSVVSELRADVDVDDLTDGRVRGYQPAPGDARASGQYQPFVIVSALDVPPHPQVPITFASYGIRAYGSTPQNAWAVWGAVVKALHRYGQRVKSNGLGIYRSSVISGGEQETDPDTAQPVVTGVIRLIATTQAVA